MKTVALFLFALVVTASALEEQEEVGVARIIGDSISKILFCQFSHFSYFPMYFVNQKKLFLKDEKGFPIFKGKVF